MNAEINNAEIVFGPVPSRRLGRSIGINNIPLKTCSYSCIYCQIGNTNILSTKRKEFYEPERIFKEVSKKVTGLRNINEKIDYITFVADGEPTLDINLGRSIELLKPLGVKIAVITNSSLLFVDEVRNDLINSDLVSVKIDSTVSNIWHKINRPHGYLNFETIIKGIKDFSKLFTGKLFTETMLVKNINDSVESLSQTARTIKSINPLKAYILVPTRPPAESFVKAPDDEVINAAYQLFSDNIENVELAISNEGTNFSYLIDSEKELLSILAVHPMQYDAVEEFLSKSNSGWKLVEDLIKKNTLKKVKYKDKYFLMRKSNDTC